MKFKEYKGLDLAKIADEVLVRWDEDNTFEQSLSTREGHPSFVFFEGPPSANGMPGIHHVMARTIKDVFCRYKTQQGFQVHRKAGWDTHGLPVELGVEKKLGITKEDIGKTITIEEYNRTCREAVMEFTGVWEDLTRKMGYWVNMQDPYITYDNKYIETLWWMLKQLYEKGLLYKGYTIQPYSPAAGTGLSSHELNQPGCYRDVKDTTMVAQFKMVDPKPEMTAWGTPYFIAWTTTPWTLPSNTALCVGPKINYVAVQTFNGYTGEKITVVLAKDLVKNHFNPKAAELVHSLKQRGIRVILATNPLFPRIATQKRIRWAGLQPEDFEFYTTFEDIGYCKPNPDYYKEVLRRANLDASDCLMVGNDVAEDMMAGAKVGLRGFLLTDCLINTPNADIEQYPHGSFAELGAYIEKLLAEN